MPREITVTAKDGPVSVTVPDVAEFEELQRRLEVLEKAVKKKFKKWAHKFCTDWVEDNCSQACNDMAEQQASAYHVDAKALQDGIDQLNRRIDGLVNARKDIIDAAKAKGGRLAALEEKMHEVEKELPKVKGAASHYSVEKLGERLDRLIETNRDTHASLAKRLDSALQKRHKPEGHIHTEYLPEDPTIPLELKRMVEACLQVPDVAKKIVEVYRSEEMPCLHIPGPEWRKAVGDRLDALDRQHTNLAERLDSADHTVSIEKRLTKVCEDRDVWMSICNKRCEEVEQAVREQMNPINAAINKLRTSILDSPESTRDQGEDAVAVLNRMDPDVIPDHAHAQIGRNSQAIERLESFLEANCQEWDDDE